MSCGKGTGAHGALCAPCWGGVEFIERPFCPVTGVPFPFDPGEGIVSAAALAAPPPYTKARAVMRYTDASARIVMRRSEEHTSELQSLMRISYAVFCLKHK